MRVTFAWSAFTDSGSCGAAEMSFYCHEHTVALKKQHVLNTECWESVMFRTEETSGDFISRRFTRICIFPESHVYDFQVK